MIGTLTVRYLLVVGRFSKSSFNSREPYNIFPVIWLPHLYPAGLANNCTSDASKYRNVLPEIGKIPAVIKMGMGKENSLCFYLFEQRMAGESFPYAGIL